MLESKTITLNKSTSMSQPYWLIQILTQQKSSIKKTHHQNSTPNILNPPTVWRCLNLFLFWRASCLDRKPAPNQGSQATKPVKRLGKPPWIEASFAISCVTWGSVFFTCFLDMVSLYTHRKNRMLGATKNIQGRYYLIFCASTYIYIYLYSRPPKTYVLTSRWEETRQN